MAKVKKWIILEDELDVLTGELTPTYKVKRSYIHKKYESKIEQLYIEPKLWVLSPTTLQERNEVDQLYYSSFT